MEINPRNLELYMVGRVPTLGELRTFKLSRMRGLQVQEGENYTIPETFDPKEFFRLAFGIVGLEDGKTVLIRLRFHKDMAYRISEGAYPHLLEMERKPLPDGRVEVTVEAVVDAVSGLPLEVLGWIFSLGAWVEVLDPPEIRAHWIAELKEALRVAEAGGESA